MKCTLQEQFSKMELNRLKTVEDHSILVEAERKNKWRGTHLFL